jgi:hypothetical protein
MNMLASIQNHLLNVKGKSIDRKVVVFESDDWGTIRIPSHSAYTRLKHHGIDLDSNPYNRVDSLETATDLQALCEVLQSFKDSNGNPAVLTANFIVANPDFERIRQTDFCEYYYETFLDSYRRSKGTEETWAMIREAIDHHLMHPQFHGREHVNVLRWLKFLREGHSTLLKAFAEGVFSIDIQATDKKRTNLLASLDFANEQEKSFALSQLIDGYRIFLETFGFKSQSFIAPANVWDDDVERTLKNAGVNFLQSLRGQCVPAVAKLRYDIKIHYTGERSSSGQLHLVRNAYFEPATLPQYDWVGNCLRKIEAAFFWNKPAIVSTHRLNYVGGICEANRQTNLLKFKSLLKQILTHWPEVEFMRSDELGRLYDSKNVRNNRIY